MPESVGKKVNGPSEAVSVKRTRGKVKQATACGKVESMSDISPGTIARYCGRSPTKARVLKLARDSSDEPRAMLRSTHLSIPS
jgi:hypothetical protein